MAAPGPDPRRVVQIASRQPDGRIELGSGYRVTNTHVLTAAHVLGSAAPERIAVESHVAGWRSGVTALLDLDDDVALLELEQRLVPGDARRIATPPYGVLDQGAGLMSAVAVGYPRWARKRTAADLRVATQPYWDLAQADGRIAVLNNLRQGTFQFDIDTAAAQPGGDDVGPGASPWQGMSGAALWRNNHLIGVITADDTPTGLPRLVATRLNHVLNRLDRDNPALAAQARSALGLGPRQRLADADFDPEFLLDTREAKALRKILIAAPAGVSLTTIYRQTVEGRWDPPENPHDLDSYIGVLRRATDASFLFRFLVRFAAATRDDDLMTRLHDWIDATAARYGVDLAEVHELRDEVRSTVLLVQLEPDLLGAGWQAKAWNFVGRSSSMSVAPDEAWSREELGQWLSSQLSALVDEFDENEGTTQVTVEFQVDDDTLDEDLEWLPVTLRGGVRHPLGATCPVVKRPLARLRQQAWMDNWEAQWQRLQKCADTHKDDVIRWIREPGPLQWEPTHVAAAFAYNWERSDWPEILRGLWEAGTPVVLWNRKVAATWGGRRALTDVLRNVGLSSVPERVLAQRINAARRRDDNHVGRDLVLIWDDPDHIPDDYQWCAPEGVGA